MKRIALRLFALCLISGLLFIGDAAATISGPAYPAPGGNTFADSGSDAGAQQARSGGRIWTYSGFNTSAYRSLWWGIPTASLVAQTGGSTAPNVSFNAVASNLAAGLAVYTGTSTTGDAVQINLTVTDGSGNPLSLVTAAPLGISGPAVVLPVTNTITTFRATLVYLAQSNPLISWYDLQNPTRGVGSGGAITIAQGDFWFDATPQIDNFTPALGPSGGGQSLTINGSFLSNPLSVKLGGTGVAAITTNTATQLVVTTPAHSAGSASVVVQTAYGTATASSNYLFVDPPTAAQSFGSATIPVGGTTTLGITLTNPASNSVGLTGVGFSDTLPSGLVIADNSGATTCGGTLSAPQGGSVIGLSGGSLSPGGSCTVSVNVQGTSAGVMNNSFNPYATEGGTGPASIGSVTVVAPPMLTKGFGAASIPLGGTTTLTLDVSNPNVSASLSGVGVTDNFPAGLVLADSNVTTDCTGTVTATGGASKVTLAGQSLAPGAACSVQVNVSGVAPGTQNNVTDPPASIEGGTGVAAAANIDVVAPPMLAKAFNPTTILVNGASNLTFTITNPAANAVTLTNVGFTDNLPAGLTIASGSNPVCGGTVTTTAPNGISVAGVSIGATLQCQFTVVVTGTATGHYVNTTGPVTSDNGGAGAPATANLDVVCSVSLSSSGTTAPAAGMSGSFNVTTGACGWTAVSDSAWLTTGSSGTGNGSVSYTVAANPLTTQRIGNIFVNDQTFTVTQAGVVPANLVATGSSTPSVALTWTSDPTDHFEIWRNSGAGFVMIGTSATTGYTDNAVSTNSAYMYEVRAVDSGSNASAYSNQDLATTVLFTDDPLVPGTTFIKAVHLAELRQAVNSLRAVAGLGAYTFTDSTLDSTVVVKVVHLTELRTALDEARSALRLPALTYATRAVGDVVVASDFTQIRESLK